jgi:hypothetical protein
MLRLIRLPIVLVLVLAACLAQASTAAAGALNVRDDAGVLTAADQQTIRDSASRAPFSVSVWTAKGGYAGNKAGFVSAADALVTNNDTVVVAVDTVEKFSHVAARNAKLTSAATAAAKTSADSSFGQAQWVAGINAALTSLTSAAGGPRVNGAPNQGGSGAPAPTQTSFPWAALLVFLVITGAIAAGVMVLLNSRRRRAVVGPQDAPPGYGTGGPGYGPSGPGYGPGGPGYGGGPGSGRGGGVGGMLAGGALGGIGGGLLGYELGKESGERRGGGQGGEDQEQGQGGFAESDQGQGGADWGDGGGGQDVSGGDFGGGGGSDF